VYTRNGHGLRLCGDESLALEDATHKRGHVGQTLELGLEVIEEGSFAGAEVFAESGYTFFLATLSTKIR